MGRCRCPTGFQLSPGACSLNRLAVIGQNPDKLGLIRHDSGQLKV